MFWKSENKFKLVIWTFFWIFWVSFDYGLAFRMVPMNLQDMIDQASRIVVGTCLSKKDGEITFEKQKEALHYIEYTFQINQVIKGSVGENLTIRQVRLGGYTTPPSSSENDLSEEQGFLFDSLPIPQYNPGKEVLLFLGKDSKLGLTSPVAMEQAVFDVQTIDGKKFLTNRLGNAFLFKGISVEQLSASRDLSPEEISILQNAQVDPDLKDQESRRLFPYNSFISLVRKLAAENP